MSAPIKIDGNRSPSKTSNATNTMTHVETFKTSIIRIRDLLRSQGITGMDSMRHICLYLMSRYMTKEKALALGIPDEFAWETLMELTLTVNGGLQYALDRFYHKEGDCLVNHFDRLFGTEKFPFDVKSLARHKETLEILDKVDMASVDLHMDVLGWVYEQHLKTGSSAARDLGQFFTDRPICTYMTELCRPAFKYPGVPESMCDPSMGTGGFQAAYMKYYKRRYSETVNWAVQQKEIHGCDTDQKVAGVARLNLFMESKGARFDHLLHHDSLSGDLPQTGYDVILANMPFGLKGLKYADCCDRVKALKINGTKSEPLFLQLMMVSLNVGGRCAVVVPDGMLVNTSACHNGTRKYLLDHFELKRVIKMRGQFFMNTGIQPSILFFENTGKATAAVEFWDVVANANGSVEETMVLSVPRAIMDDACSLDMRRYQEVKEAVNPAGFPMVKLGEIVTHENGKTLSSAEKEEEGEYDVMGGGMTYNGKTDKFNREGDTISISKSGASAGFVAFHTKKYWAGDCLTMIPKTPGCDIRYLYYYMKLHSHLITSTVSGSTIPHCKWDDIKDILVPLPPLAVQQEIVATLDRIYAPGTTELADTLKLTSQAMDLVLASSGTTQEPSGATLEPIVEAQRLIRKSAQMVADVKAQMVADVKVQMVAIVKSVGGRGFPIGKMGDHISFMNGYAFKSEEFMDAGVPVVKIKNIKSSLLSFEKVQYAQKAVKLSKYTVKPNDMVISLTGELSGDVGLNLTETEWYLNQRVARIDITDKAIHHKYMYYYMLYSGFTESVRAISTGSAQPNVSTKNIEELPMPLPPLAFQHAVIGRLDALQSQLAALESLQRQSEDNARFILESYLSTQAPVQALHEVNDDEKEEPRISPIRRPRSVSPISAAARDASGHAIAEAAVIPDYASMSLAALKDMCKERGLRGLSGKKKEDLVVILRDLS